MLIVFGLIMGIPILLGMRRRDNSAMTREAATFILWLWWILYAILGTLLIILGLISYATFGDPLIHVILFGGPVLITVTCMVVAHWLQWKQRGTWAPVIAGLPILLGPLYFWLTSRNLDTISAWLSLG